MRVVIGANVSHSSWFAPAAAAYAATRAQRASTRRDDTKRGCARPPKSAPRSAPGELDGPTAALAPGFAQANLVVLPEADAFDFLRFCVANPRPCPVLEVLEPGPSSRSQTAPGADLRTDLPRYRVYRDGGLVDEPSDVASGARTSSRS